MLNKQSSDFNDHKSTSNKSKWCPKRYVVYLLFAIVFLLYLLHLMSNYNFLLLLSIIAIIVIIALLYLYCNRHESLKSINLHDLCMYIPNIIVLFLMIIYILSCKYNHIIFQSWYSSSAVQILRALNDMSPLGILWVSEISLYSRIKKIINKVPFLCKKSKIMISWAIIISLMVVTTLIYMPSVLNL